MNGFRRQHGLVLMACLAALAVVPFLRPLPVFAAHDAGESCYNCHTLDEGEGDANSSYINKLSRTFPRIKDYDGLPAASTPANLGCTYCHNDNGRTDKMLPAITHFQGRTSFHPVGYNFVGKSESYNEYLSSYGSATTQELDCVDCHDLYTFADGQDDTTTTGVNEGTDGNAATSKGGQAGKYPEHGAPVDPVNNPYMLKSVTVANEYDAFCRICHRSDTAQTIKNGTLQLTAHADNATGRPLVETDATVLRTADLLDGNGVADVSGLSTTAQCTYCHDTHYSTNRRLFNDGHEQHKTSGGMVDDAAVTSGDCTTLCHYAGDNKNIADGGNYYKHGHGMAQSTYKYKNGKPDAGGGYVTMGYSCTACHVGLDPAQKTHVDRNPTGADDQEKYIKRYNLSSTMQSSDTGSAMGNPLVGICLSCHQSYEAHKTMAVGGIGCQDCHDEHAEGVGSTSNVMMIPEKGKKVGSYVAPLAKFAAKSGTESIIYDSTKWDTSTNPYTARTPANQDFFRQGDANGVCDSAECHAQAPITTVYSPLSVWIANPATTHSGGSQTAGADCNGCHAHNGDASGGWRAEDSCDDCHTTNGRSHLGTTKSQTMHDSHTGSGYVTGCAMCHAHDGKTVQPETGIHGDGMVNFGGGSAKMTNAFDYSDTFNTEANCSTAANGCHDADAAGEWAANSLGADACVDCHRSGVTKVLGTGTAPVSGLHNVTPTLTGQAHNEAITGGCAACHTMAALESHKNATLTGNGSVAADRSTMGLGTFYTNTADNYGTCAGTGATCHAGAPSAYRDDWRHEWNSTANYYTTATSACGGCHGDFANLWNSGAIHRTSVTASSTHGGNGTFDCKDCHALEATTNNYTFGFGTSDWFPLNASSEHGNGSIEINSNGASYNAAIGLCTACHTSSDGLHNFADTTWPIVSIAGDGMSVSCGSCHTGGSRPGSASGAHTLHLAGAGGLSAPGTFCVDCHGNNSGAGYLMATGGTHGTGSVNFANLTYTATAQRGNVMGTCRTTSCHNRSTGTLQSTAWNSTQLDCDDCHFYAASPTSALNNANPRPVSAISHNDHFDNQKVCGHCHAVPAAGDTTHVNTSTTLADMATALVDEGGVAFTDTAAVTDYTFNDTDNTCYSATNNGLGCHASGGIGGAADATRPDWDLSFVSTNCTGYCHTNHTTTAVNPVSGLHGVTPTITGQAHDESITTGCAACHTVTALASHQNGSFTGDGSVAGDRTSMGLGTFYTNTANNYGTCAGTGSACHNGTPSIYRDDWRHEWNSTAGYYTTASTSCGGCHGDFKNVWNTGVLHKTSGTAQSTHGGTTFDCKDCHALEATTNNYTFGFGTSDWFPLNASSEHGNGSIEMNNAGTSYNATSGLCAACHTGADGLHNFADTSWPIVAIVGESVSVTCGSCHTAGSTPTSSSGAHTLHLSGTAALVSPGTACYECHGNNGGAGYGSMSGTHSTGSVNFANLTYTATAQRGNVAGTCRTTSCHNRSTGTLQSTAWNTTQLDCDDCHFYAVSPTSTLNNANPRPVSAVAHNDHFDNQKTCGQCHVVPAAGDTTHVNATSITLPDKATADRDEATIAFTDTAAVTDYTFNDTDNTCYSATNNGLGCHASGGIGGAADATRPDWDLSFVSTNCTGYCHTNHTTTAVNPTSGLHAVTPTITGQAHDESITTGCAACHTVTALASHQNGSFTGNGSVAGDRTSMGLGTFYTNTANNYGTCAGTGVACHANAPSLYRDDWRHEWNSTAGYYTTASTSCGGCHGDFANVWNTGVIHRTSSAASGTHGGGGTFACENCHALESTTNNYTFGFGTSDWFPLNASSEHGNGSIEINSAGTSYNATSGLCAACHTGSPYNFTDTSWPIKSIVGETVSVSCSSCHGPGGSGPTVVYPTGTGAPTEATTVYGSHLKALNADVLSGTTDWDVQCKKCHGGTYHADGTTAANDVEIPTRYGGTTAVPTMNQQYSSHSYRIKIGGTSTGSFSTEAEMCWSCHDTNTVSEWGQNNNAATGSLAYNYGSVSSSNWTTATWSPATMPNFKYKVSTFRSTHSVNFDAGSSAVTGTAIGKYSEVVDLVGEIKCTYCHDVHDTRPVGTGETTAQVHGVPYLRGNWRGNPYPEDGAPYSTSTYTNVARYGAVPRGGTQFTQNGGYYIDQNSPNDPTSLGWTATQFGGLCEKCHANNDGTLAGTEIDALDQTTGESLWNGAINGHKNSVRGASGGGTDIFNFTHGRIVPQNNTGKAAGNRYSQGLQGQQASSRGYGYRGTSSSGGGYLPVYQTSTSFASYNWGASVTNTSNQVLYHQFSCSKCHNPHASRLPKLLITNCLDINHNSWDNAKGSVNTYYTVDNGLTDAYWASAQNCHRADDSNKKISNPGWNKVSPWGGSW